ncbi:hypothetical protein [Roseivirga pacifica]|uniref:hypothetical protein n=1 Tax=Roseivirga pacifica TaxID=1267423 RepID=UPI0011138C06|nr:hypothetical protein [Roseivirga pacifica]
MTTIFIIIITLLRIPFYLAYRILLVFVKLLKSFDKTLYRFTTLLVASGLYRIVRQATRKGAQSAK